MVNQCTFSTLTLTYLIWQPLKQQAVPLLLICLSPSMMSADLSKSNIRVDLDWLAFFDCESEFNITTPAASF